MESEYPSRLRTAAPEEDKGKQHEAQYEYDL